MSVISTCESHLFAGNAAEYGETQKRAQYQRMPEDFNLIPFVVESTGRLGPQARSLIEQLCLHHPREQREFTSDLSFILAMYKGRALSYCRSRLWRELQAIEDLSPHHNPFQSLSTQEGD